MPALEPLSRIMAIDTHELSKEEKMLLEAELFLRINEELKENLRKEYKDYFHLMKFTAEMEDAMLENMYIQSAIRDLTTNLEYTSEGIASYANSHADVVDEVMNGINLFPSAFFMRKIIELHRSQRPELYHAVMRKVALQYASTRPSLT